jgi:hypothetical protein
VFAGNGRLKALYAKVGDNNEYHPEGVYFTAIVMMYEIARSRGIDPGIDEDLVRRLHRAAYKTKGNVTVPVSLREAKTLSISSSTSPTMASTLKLIQT